MVGHGLRAVFDMIKKTETSNPLICQRGLKSLLDVLQVKTNIFYSFFLIFCFQGLLPEDLKDEPKAVMEAMFTSLLTDESHIGLVAAGKDDTFTIKFLSPSSSPMMVTGDLPIKLARK